MTISITYLIANPRSSKIIEKLLSQTKLHFTSTATAYFSDKIKYHESPKAPTALAVLCHAKMCNIKVFLRRRKQIFVFLREKSSGTLSITMRMKRLSRKPYKI